MDCVSCRKMLELRKESFCFFIITLGYATLKNASPAEASDVIVRPKQRQPNDDVIISCQRAGNATLQR